MPLDGSRGTSGPEYACWCPEHGAHWAGYTHGLRPEVSQEKQMRHVNVLTGPAHPPSSNDNNDDNYDDYNQPHSSGHRYLLSTAQDIGGHGGDDGNNRDNRDSGGDDGGENNRAGNIGDSDADGAENVNEDGDMEGVRDVSQDVGHDGDGGGNGGVEGFNY
ncbi:hypothetical protein HOY80DRAFT_1090290 [Tuber brumale]|nr:hypothetical protein HOY80DRAFT_1090290 [Tuber brumale]